MNQGLEKKKPLVASLWEVMALDAVEEMEKLPANSGEYLKSSHLGEELKNKTKVLPSTEKIIVKESPIEYVLWNVLSQAAK